MSRTDIRYERLNHENFNSRSLDGFIRRQTVREVWRKNRRRMAADPQRIRGKLGSGPAAGNRGGYRPAYGDGSVGVRRLFRRPARRLHHGFARAVRENGALCPAGLLSGVRAVSGARNRQAALFAGGARALKRLGILTICLPLGAHIIASIVYAALTHGAAASLRLSSGGSVLLGALFIVSSLLCRLGAEQATRTDPS